MPKEEKGYWFSTENGTHIHAEEGESKESAMKKKFSKFGKTESKKDSTFEEINEKRMSGKTKKQDYSKIFDEDYQRSWGIPDFKDENDVKTLNDIVEKAMEYDGEEGAIDISNNAMERIEELVKFSPEEQDKLASGTGEEIMDILRSKETKSQSLNISQGHKLSQKELDKETKGMFKSREEGEKFINETKWESEKDKQNAIDRLNSAFPKQLTEEEIEAKLKEVHSKLDPLREQDNRDFVESLRTGKKHESKNENEISRLSKESQDLIKQRDDIRKSKAVENAKKLGRKDYSKEIENFYKEDSGFKKLTNEDRVYALHQFLESNPTQDANKVLVSDLEKNRDKYPKEFEFKDEKYVVTDSGRAYDHFKKKDGKWEHISLGTIYGLGDDLYNKLKTENLVKGK